MLLLRKSRREIKRTASRYGGRYRWSKVAYRFNGIGALRAEMIAAPPKMHATQHYNLQRTQVARGVN